MYYLPTVLLATLFLYDAQSVLPLLFVCACRFLWRKTSTVAQRFLLRKTSTVPQRYDVFLSFKGEDTRTGFTDFLYNGLVAAGFHVFRDDNALRVGKQIGQELLGAIRSCRIAIPIISKNYAQSEWCLRELTEIMECHSTGDKSVFPVFYKVNVLDLKGPGGGFADDLSGHKARYRKEVQKWTKALTAVGLIRGWRSQTIANGHDGELAKIVVERVSSELKTMWIERLPIFPMLMSNYQIRSGISQFHLSQVTTIRKYSHLRVLASLQFSHGEVYGYFSEKIRGEVFLAFHGPDTRRGFAACLYSSLVDAGIRVLKDDDPCLIGADLVHGIDNAIGHCKISIPILSKNYASSQWCLDDLARMVDCKKKKGQKILPIFYKVKPSFVKEISNSYGKHMNKHEKVVDAVVYGKWEQALKEVGFSKGLESEKFADGDEGLLLKKVVDEVLSVLTNPQKT